MKFDSILILIGLLSSLTTQAQQTGKVDYTELGISFTIPNGWYGQESEDVFIIASNSQPGAIILSVEEYESLDKMRTEMIMGYQDAYGTSLKPTNEISTLDANTLGGEYVGTLEGQSAKAYVTGTVNQHGMDVFIMAVTTTELYSDDYKQLVLGLEETLMFAKPTEQSRSNDWKTLLSGVKLTYMDSYSSSSYSVGGISGGYSTETVFDLCSQGFFNYNNSDTMTIGSSSSSAYSSGSGAGNGQWEVKGNTLYLKFYNGEVWEYELSMEDGKTYLNGKRYFRTWDGEYAPNCY